MPTDAHKPPKGWSKIVRKLDVLQEFRDLGIEVVSDNPTNKDYVACWAFDRPRGDSASAGINIKTGWYKDHGGTGTGAYLYQIRSHLGFSANTDEALKFYAAKVDLVNELSMSLQAQAYAQENVQVLGTPPFTSTRSFYGRYSEISPESVDLAGGVYALWPKTSPEPNRVLAFRVLDKNESQLGYVLQSIPRNDILRWQGKDRPPERHERVVLGSSGLINEHGITVMQSDECQLVIKTEGVSDMLAVQTLIPEHLHDRISVVTNACGCKDIPSGALSLFRGRNVVVLHDVDEPGQEGARLWCNSLKPMVPHLKNVVLYEQIAEKKGKDVRDWISEGGTFEGLIEKFNATAEYIADPSHMTDEQRARMTLGSDATEEEIDDHLLLQRLGVLVLGHLEGTNRIVCYSERTARSFEIAQIDRYKIELALLHMGTVVDDQILTSTEYEPEKRTMTQLRRAIARKAANKSLRPDDRMGAGIWRIGDRVVLVNDREISIANGDMASSKVPAIGGKVIEFASDPWYLHEEVSELYEQTQDSLWCQNSFDETSAVFARWDNWKHPDSPLILTAMVCATWIQTTLDFRPGMVVTGPTNSGKTMLTQECVSKMFGKQALFVTNPTEAGIRQAIGFTSRVLMIDEFESSIHRQKILEVLRSSTRGTDIVKGTMDHRGTRFHFRHIPWLSSIETGLRSAADRNRYIILELDHLPKGRSSTLQVPPIEELEEIGLKLMVIGMRFHGRIRELHGELKATTVSGVDRRIVEAYSLPVAVLAAVSGLSMDESQQLLRDMLGSRFDEEDFECESDEEGLLEAIAMLEVSTRAGTFQVVDLLKMSSWDLETYTKSSNQKSETPESVLRRVGIKKTRLVSGKGRVASEELDGLAVATNTLTGRLKGTRFQFMNIAEILSRVAGSRSTSLHFGGKRLPCVVIPESALVLDGQEIDKEQTTVSSRSDVF